MTTTFTEIGKTFTQGNEEKFNGIFASAEWQDLPLANAPMGQGMAVQGAINEWRIPAKRVSLYGSFGHLGVYGIETKKQRIFFIDEGVSLTPIALVDMN